jgi:hypothetical protein
MSKTSIKMNPKNTDNNDWTNEWLNEKQQMYASETRAKSSAATA